MAWLLCTARDIPVGGGSQKLIAYIPFSPCRGVIDGLHVMACWCFVRVGVFDMFVGVFGIYARGWGGGRRRVARMFCGRD